MKKPDCFFCNWEQFRKDHVILNESQNFYVHRDDYPVSKGHIEIAPKEHLESFFDLSDELAKELLQLLKKEKERLNKECKPDGYNIGINEGEAAGRTIDHFHLHLIPRYNGDIENPRGGVRNVIPNKANY